VTVADRIFRSDPPHDQQRERKGRRGGEISRILRETKEMLIKER
jgi:hypothetical protein